MGVYYRESNKYIVKYEKNSFVDLKNILEDVLHYFNADSKWVYIIDKNEIYEKFADEEFGYNLENRNIDIDSHNQLLSIEGIYEREHGEGTHLEINEDYLYKKLFDYNPRIIVIKESDFITDYDTHSDYHNKEIIYKFNNLIQSLYINKELVVNNFDEIVNSSDLKYFINEEYVTNKNKIIDGIANINSENVFKYYSIYKEYFDEKNIIELVQKDFLLINNIDKDIANEILNDEKIMMNCMKNISFFDLEVFDEKIVDDIINNKKYILKILQNSHEPFYDLEDIIGDNLFEKYQNDKDIIISLISNHNYPYDNVSMKLKNDKDVLLAAIKSDIRVFKNAPLLLRDDENLLGELMKIDSNAYKYASKRLKDKYKPLSQNKKHKNDDNITQLSLPF